jgi:branched-chain amino acid transport system substrate-binding protein
MKPAGLEASQGIISSTFFKDPTDPQWKDYPDMKAWNQFLDKYYPDANRADGNLIYGYMAAQALEHVLKACGDNLTRENVMKQAASLKDLELSGLLPGITLTLTGIDPGNAQRMNPPARGPSCPA